MVLAQISESTLAAAAYLVYLAQHHFFASYLAYLGLRPPTLPFAAAHLAFGEEKRDQQPR
jgi:hypothetical protein